MSLSTRGEQITWLKKNLLKFPEAEQIKASLELGDTLPDIAINSLYESFVGRGSQETDQITEEPYVGSGRKKHQLIGVNEADNRDDEFILKAQMSKLERSAISLRHQNQRKAANDIISEFTQDRNTLLVAAVGKTQSGKTGVMYSLIMEATNTSIDGYVPVTNVFVITGLSSNEWKEQTKTRLPEVLRENVFHRSELNKGFKEKINEKKNILIIVDEIQIASQLKQSLHKSFSDILDTKYMIENDIKIVEFSATPNGTYGNLEYWEGHYKTVKIQPGLGYVGHKELYEQGRMFQCQDLTVQEHVEKLHEQIQGTFDSPKYHIIRTKVGDGQDECVEVFKRVVREGFNYLYHDSENLESIDSILDKEPEKHTIIFLKEMARCAKTFKKKFIGVWYERYVKSFNDDVAVQGLAGRATGYDDNGVSIVYTNMESMTRFIDLWEKDFSPEVPWDSNTTKYSEKKKRTLSKKTVNSAIGGKDKPKTTIVEIKQHKREENQTLQEFWAAPGHKWSHARNPFKGSNIDENGFYKASTTGKKRAYLLSEIIKATSPLKGSSGFDVKDEKIKDASSGEILQTRGYVCYEDFSEKSKKHPILYKRVLKKV